MFEVMRKIFFLKKNLKYFIILRPDIYVPKWVREISDAGYILKEPKKEVIKIHKC